jgi:hypothetical protein
MKHDLGSTFVVLQPDQRAALVQNAPGVFEELDRRFSGFKGHVLIATFAFDADWPTWERHPAGDELVCLLSGSATLVLDGDRGQGTWHTARTRVASNMLFVTPGEGTENKPL